MSLRKDRLADQIRDILAACFFGGKMSDPRLEGVTITHVKLSADLQMASVYFRCYEQSQEQQSKVGLERSKGFLRRQLADSLSLRRVPELRFFYDESIEHGARIESLLKEIKS